MANGEYQEGTRAGLCFILFCCLIFWLATGMLMCKFC